MSITETLHEAPRISPLSTGTTQKIPEDIDLCQCATYGDMSEITIVNSTDCNEHDSNQQSVRQSTSSSYKDMKPTGKPQRHPRSETIVEESSLRRTEMDCITVDNGDDDRSTQSTSRCDSPPVRNIQAPEIVTEESAQKSDLSFKPKRADPRIRSLSSFSSSEFSLRRRTSTMDSVCHSLYSQHDQHEQPTPLFHPIDDDSFRRLLGDRKRRTIRARSSSCSSFHPPPTPKIMIGALVGESNIVDHNNDVQEEKWSEREFKRSTSTAKQKLRTAVRLVNDIVRCVRYTLIQPWKQLVVQKKPQDEVTFSRAKGRLV